MDVRWQERGNCYGLLYELGIDIWFPADRDTHTTTAEETSHQRQAVKICQGCPVMTECLDTAVKFEAPGVWGGMTSYERTGWRKKHLGHAKL
jgi:hypothetical protein